MATPHVLDHSFRPTSDLIGCIRQPVFIADRFERILTFLEMAGDGTAAFISIWISYLVYKGLELGKQAEYGSLTINGHALVVAVLMVLILDLTGSYRLGNSLLRIKETERVLKSTVSVSALLLPLSFLFKEDFPRLLVGIAFFVLPITVLLQKQSLYSFVRYLHKRGLGVRRVLIYGAGFTGRRVYSALNRSPKLGLTPVACIDDDNRKAGKRMYESSYLRDRSVAVIAEPLDSELLQRMNIKMLIVAIPSMNRQRLSAIVKMANNAGVSVAFVPGDLGAPEQQLDSVDIDGLLLARALPVNSRVLYEGSKRLFDLLLSSVVLSISSPVLVLIAILIKLDSPGPIVFRQKRVGAGGRLFSIYKFRTMRSEMCGDGYSPKSKVDPRITRVGRTLRRLSLDEMPQLINVIRGEMSLVGPRPEMEFIVAGYNDIQRQRLAVKPGITGLWQLSADRRFLIHENIQYDLYYIKNRSFFLDIAILLHTLFFAVRGV